MKTLISIVLLLASCAAWAQDLSQERNVLVEWCGAIIHVKADAEELETWKAMYDLDMSLVTYYSIELQKALDQGTVRGEDVNDAYRECKAARMEDQDGQ